MPTLRETAGFVRSKNAGPFWLTIDIFFDDADSYERAKTSPALTAGAVGRIYGAEEAETKLFEIDALRTIKISLPRRPVQGHRHERDMHAGQQYVSILDLELG